MRVYNIYQLYDTLLVIWWVAPPTPICKMLGHIRCWSQWNWQWYVSGTVSFLIFYSVQTRIHTLTRALNQLGTYVFSIYYHWLWEFSVSAFIVIEVLSPHCSKNKDCIADHLRGWIESYRESYCDLQIIGFFCFSYKNEDDKRKKKKRKKSSYS